jgi:hypothetical protein
VAASPAPVAQAWTDILSHDPFSFDRTDIDIVPVAASAPPRPVPPKPVLFGTMTLGKFKAWTVVKIDKRSVVVETDGAEESLVMGNVPIDRDAAGKTSMSVSSPSVSTTATATPSPSSTPAPTTSAPVSPAAVPAGTPMVETPFGPKPLN